MSFGFSVSDIYICARLAYKLYNEYRRAPGACQEFAREILLLHQVLLKVKSNVESDISHLSHSDQAALGAYLDSCKKLLCVQMIGDYKINKILQTKIDIELIQTEIVFPNHYRTQPNTGLRQKNRYMRFAPRIPQLQFAISALVEKLTAFNVLLIQYVLIE